MKTNKIINILAENVKYKTTLNESEIYTLVAAGVKFPKPKNPEESADEDDQKCCDYETTSDLTVLGIDEIVIRGECRVSHELTDKWCELAELQAIDSMEYYVESYDLSE